MFSFIFWLAVLVFVLRIACKKNTKEDDWRDYAWWLPDEWKRKK